MPRLRAPIMDMDQPLCIHNLADEILSEILDLLLEPAPRAVNGKFNGNGHTKPKKTIIQYGEATDLDRFRLVCKRFMRIGTPHRFSRFTLRFSEHGFRRLDELLHMQLACYVKSVTYMVRPFYQGSGWPRLLQDLENKIPALSQVHSQRLQEQTNITERNIDQTLLRLAFASSPALQEIKLLRLQDVEDDHLIQFLRTAPTQTTLFTWEPACTRAITTLSSALLTSTSSIRFTAPQLSPESTLHLLHTPPSTLSQLATRLIALDINIPANEKLTTSISSLSAILRRFLLAAKNLVALHIGFLSKTPLTLSLDSVFHHIRWKTLRKLSIQGWRLDASEIIALARRHTQLHDFRLVAIYLRSGMWSDILVVLREEMRQLEHLELREIDYAHFENGSFDGSVGPAPSALNDEGGTVEVGVSAVPVLRGRGGLLKRSSMEKLGALGVEDLRDDGVRVMRRQLPLWEAWVLSSDGRKNGNGNGRVAWNM